jgi:hypothetical protein
MRTTLGSFLHKLPDHYRSFQRAKTTAKSFIGDFLAQDAVLAQNVAGNQMEWNREWIKGCPAIAAAVTPIHFGWTRHVLGAFQPKDKGGPSTPMVDIDTLAAVFGGNGGGLAGAGRGGAAGRI